MFVASDSTEQVNGGGGAGLNGFMIAAGTHAPLASPSKRFLPVCVY